MDAGEAALPENPNLPSVSAFAECQTTGTRQRCCLSSARPRALGKNLAHGMPGLYRVPAVGKAGHSAKCLLCRVLARRHSAKPAHVPSTRARRVPPVRGADGVKSLPSATFWHSAKDPCCRVPPAGTRQRRNFAECAGLALGKVSFAECWSLGTQQNWLKKFLDFKFFCSLLKFDNLIASNIKYFY